jgi:hypothetical protein
MFEEKEEKENLFCFHIFWQHCGPFPWQDKNTKKLSFKIKFVLKNDC